MIQKSSSKLKDQVSQKRAHEIEWRNSWISTWIAATVLIPLIIKIMDHSSDGILKWICVIALSALAGSLGLYGLLNLILLMQKRC